MKLNLDTLHVICQYIPVADIPKVIISLYPDATTSEIQSVKSQTRDSSIFFKDLTSEIPKLMTVMKISNAYLIGMRAFSYFHYIELSVEHPWEFICTGNHFSYLSFINHLQTRGVIWNHMKLHNETSIPRCSIFDDKYNDLPFSNGPLLVLTHCFASDKASSE
jgi:hypothetical protein